jgi:hypothetical protein
VIKVSVDPDAEAAAATRGARKRTGSAGETARSHKSRQRRNHPRRRIADEF